MSPRRDLLARAACLIRRTERLLDRVEPLLPAPPPEPDWQRGIAWRWHRGRLRPIRHPAGLRLEDLRAIDRQKAELDRNTRQFLFGAPANNALLWGARGTGKSSLIKALLAAYCSRGLRVIEVDKHDLMDLYEIADPLHGRPERFVLYCDDLSFETGERGYKALKAVLDGSIAATPDNVLLYATSNRRHLLPELKAENLESRIVDGELHHGEAVEEKISLSERFGVWLSFRPFSQDQYLEIAGHWLVRLGGPPVMDEEVRQEALQWALLRGSRSGRAAWQFARDWIGRRATAP